MLKVVIDTNIFVAGFLSKNKMSYPAQMLSMWRAGAFILVISPQILREIVANLYEKGISEDTIEEFVELVGEIGLRIPGAYESTRLDKIDPDDNKILAAAYESNADFIVTYDKRSLLPMKHFHATQIVVPELFMRNIISPEKTDEIAEADQR